MFGRRDVLFMNEDDMAQSGLETRRPRGYRNRPPRQRSASEGHYRGGVQHRAGTVGAYYPEANVLVPLDYLDKDSGTPSYKSVSVRITLRSKEIRML